MYLYLQQGQVELKFEHPLVQSMIIDIMAFHNKRKLDVKQIQKQLVAEERLFVGKIRYIHKKIDKTIEKIKEMELNQKLREEYQKTDMEETFYMFARNKHYHSIARNQGLPFELLENADKLVIVSL
jgi:hypothetical protein